MDRNDEDGLPQPHAEPYEQLTKPNENLSSEAKNEPAQPQNAEPEPVERPDLDWAEHED